LKTSWIVVESEPIGPSSNPDLERTGSPVARARPPPRLGFAQVPTAAGSVEDLSE
jgi:hypothetical protein